MVEASHVFIVGRDHDPFSSRVQAGSPSLPSMCAISLLSQFRTMVAISGRRVV